MGEGVTTYKITKAVHKRQKGNETLYNFRAETVYAVRGSLKDVYGPGNGVRERGTPNVFRSEENVTL